MTTVTAQEDQLPRRWAWEAGWLSGPRYDFVLILGVLAVALASGALVVHRPELFMPVLLIDLWLLGYHHVIATFTKLAGTEEDRRENRFLIYYAPVIVLVSVVVLAQTIGLWTIITIYFFWQWFHYTRQSYGISVFYRRRGGMKAESPWLSHGVIWAVPIWGVLNRCSQGWDSFLFQPIWMPAVSPLVASAAGVIALTITGWWLITRLIAWRNGTLVLGHTLFTLSHLTMFATAYGMVDDINHGWLIANVWHNAQYILFVWLYNTRRFEKYTGGSGALLAWASRPQPVRILVYFAGCLLLTTIFYGMLTKGLKFAAQEDQAFLTMLYVVAFQTVNFHHYVVDAYIWKARKAKNQQVMNLKS